MTTRPPVEVGRPFGYLCAAGVLALGSLFPGLLGGGAAAPAAPAPAVAAPDGSCTGGVQDSLRPSGPLPAPGAMPAGSTMERIAQRGRLVAGVDQGKYKVGFRDPDTGDLRGADIDLAKAIARAVFGDDRDRVTFVALGAADRERALGGTDAGADPGRATVDVVVNTYTVSCGRQQKVAFSSPYLTTTQRLLVPRNSRVGEVEDLRGQRVCTSRGSTTVGVLRGLPLGLDVQELDTVPDCMLELQAGRVAAVSSDDVILAGLAAQDPQTGVVGRALDRGSYAVGLPKGADDLVRFVNGVLEQGRRDGSLAAIDQRWFTGTLDPVPGPPPARYRD